MKGKNKVVLAGAACAVSLGMGLVSNCVYADTTGLTRIYAWGGSVDDSCDYYNVNSNSSNVPCDSTYGSYDSSNNTLTLGSGIDGRQVYILDSSTTAVNTYTIKASSDIEAALVAPDNANITFDLENHTLTQPEGQLSPFGMPSESGEVVWKSGKLSMSSILGVKDITIENGEIEFEGDNGMLVDGDLTMNNGTLATDHLFINNGNVTINGGAINVIGKGDSAGILFSSDSGHTFNLNNGEINIASNNSKQPGISASGKVTTNINGGEMNISGVDNGIILVGETAAINFEGGVTTIKNSSRHALYAGKVANYENAIAFGENMGIIEPELYIFYEETNDNQYSTGVIAPDTLTIAQGGTVRRVHGYRTPDSDGKASGEQSYDFKVPNTGAFSSSNSAAFVAVSLASLAAVSGALYAIRYALKRRSSRVGFKK